MKQLWAPWRMKYILMRKPKGCIFCKLPKEKKDEENLILYRGSFNFIVLNNYPYNNGHLMVAPYRHVKDLEGLSKDELYEHIEVIRMATSLLKKTFKPDGFNLGLNIGKIAGAGVEGHLHTHIVPRWAGDTNFMPIIADTKVIIEALMATYQKLRTHLLSTTGS